MKNDPDRLAERVATFLTRHRSDLANVTSVQSNVFEAACFVLFVRHYEEAGYDMRAENLLSGKFRFKYSTNGYPWNYSYFAALTKEDGDSPRVLFEVRHNQQVCSAWISSEEVSEDPPVFAVDVAVVRPDSLPHLRRHQAREERTYWVRNDDLITFGEAKKLKAYPMLLAQFLGIVHETKPEFLRLKEAELTQLQEARHPCPVLFTSDSLTGGTLKVLASFADRGYLITVIDDVMTLPEEELLNKFDNAASWNARETGPPL